MLVLSRSHEMLRRHRHTTLLLFTAPFLPSALTQVEQLQLLTTHDHPDLPNLPDSLMEAPCPTTFGPRLQLV